MYISYMYKLDSVIIMLVKIYKLIITKALLTIKGTSGAAWFY